MTKAERHFTLLFAARFRILRDCSDEGLSKEEAATRAGIALGSVDGILFKHLGSTRWPIPDPPSNP